MNRHVSIFSLTAAGHRLGELLRDKITHSSTVKHYSSVKPFTNIVQGCFREGHGLILICATGIAVRTLAPVLDSKLTDPPVLVLDEQGQFVIPLLSGHEGGANEWASSVASVLKAQLVITTANAYLKPKYAVGMGCERGCSQKHLLELFERTLSENNLSRSDISCISSIELKADEVGLIGLAKELSLPFRTYSADQLNQMDHLLSTRSDYIFKTVGVYGVAESAALYAALNSQGNKCENDPELVQNKIKTAKATCAVARCFADNQN